MTKDVFYISFSAFFADLGYQAALAIFPIFLVVTLGAPASAFGTANAIAFGIGSAFGYLGGLMSDRFSDKKVAIFGNALIPLISLMGLASNPTTAVLLFSGGWWARNFRTPARRAMLVKASAKEDRGKSFGFLHALDIGGGMLSVAFVLVMAYIGLAYSTILLLTVLPLIVSTILLFFTRETRKAAHAAVAKAKSVARGTRIAGSTYKGIIISTSLYGFSSYSLGFPILTIAQSSNALLGIGSYGVYLGISAVVGYKIGSMKALNKVGALGILGYVLSGLGTLILALGYALHESVLMLYIGVAVLGFALGVVETLEPTLISFIKGVRELGRGMGALAGSRSFGIFFANLIMGVLYVINPFDSYVYATTVSLVAGALMLYLGRGFKA